MISLLPLALVAAPAPPPPRFEGRAEVAEVSVLVEPDEGRRGDLDADELLLTAGGRERSVTAVAEVGDERWPVTVYLDALLVNEVTAGRSLLGLARQAERLTALGPVRVLVADPEGRVETLLPPTEAPRAVLWALADLAWEPGSHDRIGELRTTFVRSERDAALAASSASAEVELVRERLALLRESVGSCAGPACVLLWITEGWFEAPSRFYGSGGGVEDAAADAALAGAAGELARDLSLDRWLVAPTAVRRPAAEEEVVVPGGAEFDRWYAAVPPSESEWLQPIPTTTDRGLRLSLPALGEMLQLRAHPLTRIAGATLGEPVLLETEIPDRLAELRRRRRVWFRVEEGEVGPAEVTLRRRNDGSAVEAVRWIRLGRRVDAGEAPPVDEGNPSTTDEERP